MKNKKLLIAFFCFLNLFFGIQAQVKGALSDLYLGIAKEKYLIGEYQGNEVHKSRKTEKSLMRPDVLAAYEKMVEAYEKDRKLANQAEPIVVLSGFRSFAHQKKIWETKYQNYQIKYSKDELKDKNKILDILFKILEYSSTPGTSRHHWGTDLDLNALENAYFEKGGKGEFLYTWLQKNAEKFGFCQPYNDYTSRKNIGYFPEKWHWSYFPVSNQLMKEWIQALKEKKIDLKGKFSGSEVMSKEILLNYVSSVNKTCIRN